MKDRLKQIRLKLGYNLVQMAEKLNVEANTYKGYEYKTKNFPCDFLISLIKILNVNVNWLLTGEGGMFADLPKNENSEDYFFKLTPIQNEKEIKENLIKDINNNNADANLIYRIYRSIKY